MISDETIDNLRTLAAAASPAPWHSMIEGRDHQSGDSFIRTGSGDDIYLIPATPGDQDFIAAARNSIGDLLDEIERLRS